MTRFSGLSLLDGRTHLELHVGLVAVASLDLGCHGLVAVDRQLIS